jgi:hypothetical protein
MCVTVCTIQCKWILQNNENVTLYNCCACFEQSTKKNYMCKTIACHLVCFFYLFTGEAGVPFFQCSGSEFDEMYVGLGAKRVREMFSKFTYGRSLRNRSLFLPFLAKGNVRFCHFFTFRSNLLSNQLIFTFKQKF